MTLKMMQTTAQRLVRDAIVRPGARMYARDHRGLYRSLACLNSIGINRGYDQSFLEVCTVVVNTVTTALFLLPSRCRWLTDRKFGRGDTGRLYQTFPVCVLCYELYQREQDLKSVERKFRRTIRTAAADSTCTLLPKPKPVPGLQPSSKRTPWSSWGRCAPQVCSLCVSGMAVVPMRPGAQVGPMPEEATLCRMLVLFHALHDVPDELLLGKELRPQRSTPFLTEAVSESDNEGSDGNSSGDEGDRAASPIAVGDGDTGDRTSHQRQKPPPIQVEDEEGSDSKSDTGDDNEGSKEGNASGAGGGADCESKEGNVATTARPTVATGSKPKRAKLRRRRRRRAGAGAGASRRSGARPPSSKAPRRRVLPRHAAATRKRRGSRRASNASTDSAATLTFHEALAALDDIEVQNRRELQRARARMPR